MIMMCISYDYILFVQSIDIQYNTIQFMVITTFVFSRHEVLYETLVYSVRHPLSRVNWPSGKSFHLI